MLTPDDILHLSARSEAEKLAVDLADRCLGSQGRWRYRRARRALVVLRWLVRQR